MNLDFLLKKEWILLLGAVALLAAAGLYYWFVHPSDLTVAVARRDTPSIKLMEAYSRALVDQSTGIRVRVVPYDDVRDSAEALRRKEVDLAIVRPDVLFPENGLTLALLRQQAAIILAPQASKISEVGQLGKKKLGLVSGHEADKKFFTDLLAFYDLAPPKVTIVPLDLNNVENALSSKQVDAVMMLAVPGGGPASDLVRAASKGGERKLNVLPVAEADALALRFPTLSPTTIPGGTFGGRPKVPEDDVKTVGTTYRLMARSNLGRSTAASVTEYLFVLRSRLALETPAANLVKAPDVDNAATATGAVLPIHPGAVDYYLREQKTFMDRYSDWIWLVLIFGGSAFSGLAGVMQRLARKRRELVDVILDRLLEILAESRKAENVGKLDELALEMDRLVVHAVRYARHRATGTTALNPLILGIDSARAAILDRRREILDANTPFPQRAGEAPLEAVPRSVAALNLR